MAEFINTIDVLGDEVACASIVDKTITEFKDDIITTIGERAFYKNTVLTLLDLPMATHIITGAFNGCSALMTLILRNTTICTLGNNSAFDNTPIKNGGTGYIYVPRALVESYKSATNWSNFSTQFRALEDYTVDGTITGELDETKI